jgi:hypothetical protein
MRVKVRKTSSGRYALGFDIEFAVDGSKPGKSEPKGTSLRHLDADGLDDERLEDETDTLEDEALAAEQNLDEGADDADESALRPDGDEEEDEAFATEQDDDEPRQRAFADNEDRGDEDAPRAGWPNRRPVMKGVLDVSQAPALFDDDDDDDELEPGGRAGEQTPQAPEAPEPKPVPRAQAVKRLLDEARKTIGLGEKPPGSNHNKITVWYNKNVARIGNGPWCNMAVTYWAGLSSNLAAIFAGKGVGYAYTVAHAQKFQKKGRWRKGVAGIRPGDIVFFDWGGSRSIKNVDHVGVVEQVKGKRIVTIEGNTTGDRCRRMVRDAKFIAGYGRPAYAA